MAERAMRVAVLMGGRSAEREVSLSTGRECGAALREAGFEVVEVDALGDLPARLSALAAEGPVVAFNALHGPQGEDGCVQGLLEWMRVPYTHSGVLASALAMDKSRAKEAMAAAGLPVAAHRLVGRAAAMAGHAMAPPYVVKPNADGSSFGVHIVREGAPPPADLAGLPEEVMVEAYAPGRELTVTVLGAPGAERPLGVTEIVTEGWYDYAAKYEPGGSRHVIPADIPAPIDAACREMAVRAHRTLGCRGVTRTDFRWDEARGTQGIIVLEINTQPGMTPTSLTPEQARHDGMSFPDLVRWMVEDASCDR